MAQLQFSTPFESNYLREVVPGRVRIYRIRLLVRISIKLENLKKKSYAYSFKTIVKY